MTFSTSEKQFLSAASVRAIVPSNPQIPPTDLLQESDGDDAIQDNKQRSTLFFDERTKVYVVLQIPQCAEDVLKFYLSRLDLKIEVWASSTERAERSSTSSAPFRELIFTDSINRDQDPLVLINEDESSQSIILNLIWEIQTSLHRPRNKLQDAYINFVPVASISSREQNASELPLLEPFKPRIENLFEPLQDAYDYGGSGPYLPVSRLDAVLPLPPKDGQAFHIRSIASPSVSASLAFVTRFRYTRPTQDNASTSVIASLDIEVVPFVRVQGKIIGAEALLQRGRVTPFLANMLPIDFQSKDCITFLYKLQQNGESYKELETSSSAYVDQLSMKINVELGLVDGSKVAIETRWTTNVEFIPSIGSGAAALSMMNQHSSGRQHHTMNSKTHSLSESLSISLQPLTQYSGPKIVTVSFAASTAPVKPGIPFSWKVLIVNRTDKVAKLAIIPLPRVQKPTSQAQQYVKQHAQRSSITSVHASERKSDGKAHSSVAQAVIDENVIYAMQHSNAVPPETDLMSITSELRVGPLGPGQCHEDELKLIAFKSGAFTLDAVRVVDLVKEMEQGYGSPGVIMDIKDLPDIIVHDLGDSSDA